MMSGDAKASEARGMRRVETRKESAWVRRGKMAPLVRSQRRTVHETHRVGAGKGAGMSSEFVRLQRHGLFSVT